MGSDQHTVERMHRVWRLVREVLPHRSVGHEDLIDVEAVIAGVLVFLLHYPDDRVRNVSEVDRLPDRGATWKQLLANVSPDESDVTSLSKILIVIEAAFADLDGSDLGEWRRGACHRQRCRVEGAVNENVALSQLGDDVFAIGRFFAHERQVDIS